MVSTEAEIARAGFASRMNEICDDKNVQAGRGRQIALAAEFAVTGKAARKWLLGLGYPEMAMAVRLADWAGVNLTWLLQGVGPKHGARVDAKALLLDEAVRTLPRDQAIDLLDNLRSKLERSGRVIAGEPTSRYTVMLDAYEHEIGRKGH